jgi:HlyD family secretion protein
VSKGQGFSPHRPWRGTSVSPPRSAFALQCNQSRLPPAVSHRLRLFVSIVSVACAAAGLIWYYTRPEPVAVVLKPVERGRVEATVANTRAGTVKACRRARVSPATGGQVAKLAVHEGDRVHAGQVLLELWNDDLVAQLRLAESEAIASRAKSEEACVQSDMVEREAKRQLQLKGKGLVSEDVVDRAVSDAAAHAAACRAAKAAAQVGDARIAVIRAELDRTVLKAPFDGVVAELNAKLGEFVTPSPLGIPTPPAVDLIDDRCPYVEAPIDEVDSHAIRTGLPARVALDAFPGRRFEGRVSRIAPDVLDREKQARTVAVDVDFADPDETTALLAGYSADVEIVLQTHDNVLRIPTEAVLEGHKVLVYNPRTKRLKEWTIQTGLTNWEFTEVRAGLTPGERVVVSVGRAGVKDGARVKPEQPPQTAAATR